MSTTDRSTMTRSKRTMVAVGKSARMLRAGEVVSTEALEPLSRMRVREDLVEVAETRTHEDRIVVITTSGSRFLFSGSRLLFVRRARP